MLTKEEKTAFDTIIELTQGHTLVIELIARQRGYQGDKAGLDILRDDWGRIQGVGILKDLANNPGAGGVAAAGAGMGMGIGAAGAFGSIAQQVFAPAQNGFAPQQPTNPTQKMHLRADSPKRVLHLQLLPEMQKILWKLWANSRSCWMQVLLNRLNMMPKKLRF